MLEAAVNGMATDLVTWNVRDFKQYLDFSRHWGFEITPCNIRAGNEKGRVENGVGYVKKNLLAGLELPDFCALQPQAKLWVDTVADVRTHEATQQRPIERFEDERTHLGALNPAGFDLARVCTVRANKQFRVPLDSKTNSVYLPRDQAGRNQQHLLRQINLVGLNRPTRMVGGGEKGFVSFAPGPFGQIMTWQWTFVAATVARMT